MKSIKKDFPIFVNNPDVTFLDSGASTQKPAMVIDGIKHFLENDYANIHRGFYSLSERAEEVYEKSKQVVANAIGSKTNEIIYTYNSTYGVNILAQSLVRSGMLKKGDKILLSIAEHHANVVPWLILKEDYGIEIDYIGIDGDYQLDFNDFAAKYDESVKLVACTWVSNVTGAIFDMKKLGSSLREDTLFVVDGSQAVPNFKIDVKEINADFLVFTGHKMMADTGIGVLYAKREHLKMMSPAVGGGGSIKEVDEQSVSFQKGAHGYEPGTPNLSGAVSLLKAFEYIESIGGYDEVWAREEELTSYALSKFNARKDKLDLVGHDKPEGRLGVFSFVLKDGISSLKLGEKMSEYGICIRCGGHCAHPLLKNQQLPGTCRMSLYFYNDLEDIDKFFEILDKIVD